MVVHEIRVRNADRVAMAYRRAPDVIGPELERTVRAGTGVMEAAVVEETPQGATGLLRQSITQDFRGSALNMTGRVISTDHPLKVASVEHGRKPGKMPPVDALIPWVKRKFGGGRAEAFLVARAIGRRGTKGVKMFQKGFDSRRGQVERMFDRVVDDIVRRF